MISERIKNLREQNRMTQTELAKKLGITRSSVNAWEMGISVPSTQYLVELSQLFNVSTDYLLGLKDGQYVNIGDLADTEKALIYEMIKIIREKRIKYQDGEEMKEYYFGEEKKGPSKTDG